MEGIARTEEKQGPNAYDLQGTRRAYRFKGRRESDRAVILIAENQSDMDKQEAMPLRKSLLTETFL